MPELSVVMPVRNPRTSIWAAVESVLNQDVDLELIVVDDGSAREQRQVFIDLARLSQRVRVVQRATSGGIVAALNTGHDAARGTWRIKLDDDDRFEAGSLARLMAAARVHGEQHYCYGDTHLPVQGITHCPGAWWPGINRETHMTWYAILWPGALWGQARYWKPTHLPIYHEDWDFVLQLERLGVQGVHTPGVALHYWHDPAGGGLMNRARPYLPAIHRAIHERFG